MLLLSLCLPLNNRKFDDGAGKLRRAHTQVYSLYCFLFFHRNNWFWKKLSNTAPYWGEIPLFLPTSGSNNKPYILDVLIIMNTKHKLKIFILGWLKCTFLLSLNCQNSQYKSIINIKYSFKSDVSYLSLQYTKTWHHKPDRVFSGSG